MSEEKKKKDQCAQEEKEENIFIKNTGQIKLKNSKTNDASYQKKVCNEFHEMVAISMK